MTLVLDGLSPIPRRQDSSDHPVGERRLPPRCAPRSKRAGCLAAGLFAMACSGKTEL